MNPITKFTIGQLLKNYVHVGHRKNKCNQNFYNYVTGFYYNQTIINISYTLILLKQSIGILNKILVNNGKVLVGGEFRFNVKEVNFFSNFFIFGKWPKGLITNLKRAVNEKTKRLNIKTKIYMSKLPDLAFLIYLKSINRGHYYVYEEFYKTGLPYISIVNDIEDLTKIFYWIPSNNEAYSSRYFYLSLIENLFKRNYYFKKKLFFENLKKNEKKFNK